MNHSSDGGSTRSRGGQVPGSRGITGSPFPSGSPGIRAEQPGLRQPDDVRSATDSFTFRLQTFNSGSRTTTLYNVVAAIPGAWESDRWVSWERSLFSLLSRSLVSSNSFIAPIRFSRRL